MHDTSGIYGLLLEGAPFALTNSPRLNRWGRFAERPQVLETCHYQKLSWPTITPCPLRPGSNVGPRESCTGN
jgi:hypothetical protein